MNEPNYHTNQTKLFWAEMQLEEVVLKAIIPISKHLNCLKDQIITQSPLILEQLNGQGIELSFMSSALDDLAGSVEALTGVLLQREQRREKQDRVLNTQVQALLSSVQKQDQSIAELEQKLDKILDLLGM